MKTIVFYSPLCTCSVFALLDWYAWHSYCFCSCVQTAESIARKQSRNTFNGEIFCTHVYSPPATLLPHIYIYIYIPTRQPNSCNLLSVNSVHVCGRPKALWFAYKRLCTTVEWGTSTHALKTLSIRLLINENPQSNGFHSFSHVHFVLFFVFLFIYIFFFFEFHVNLIGKFIFIFFYANIILFSLYKDCFWYARYTFVWLIWMFEVITVFRFRLKLTTYCKIKKQKEVCVTRSGGKRYWFYNDVRLLYVFYFLCIRIYFPFYR